MEGEGGSVEVLHDIPVELDSAALMGRLRIEEGSDDARDFDALLAAMLERARPKAAFVEACVEARGEDTVTLGGVTFTSRVLRKNLGDIGRVFPFVATCGAELDGEDIAAAIEGDILKGYWADQVREAVLRVARRRLGEELASRYALGKTSSMAPGSGDATVWPIEEQRPLFELLGDVGGAIGVTLTESLLMVPRKSVSGIVFPTEVDFRTCRLCRREGCPGRAAEFDAGMWEACGLGGAPRRD